MIRLTAFVNRFAALLCLLVCLAGCMKDKCSHTYTLYTPVYKTLTAVRANMKSSAPAGIKIPGKLYLYGNYIFLNDRGTGIHIIDNTIPASPKKAGFISIPGNIDLAVTGNILYADSYNDLVTFDISNPQQVKAVQFNDNVFPHRKYYGNNTNNPDSIKIIVDWIAHDTTVSCETYQYLYENYYATANADVLGSYASPNVGGRGGSLACFTLMNNYLYTVTNSSLNIFNITNPFQPALQGVQSIGWGIETIYPFNDKLFIGSNTGMFIFDVSSGGSPKQVSQFAHVRSCDPVIADGNFAYVTLRTGTTCAGGSNQLDVLNIENVTSPALVRSYPLTNPQGLSKDGKFLFVCDGKDGLKVFDAGNPKELALIKTISGIYAYEVICWNKRAVVIAADGLYQFDYSDGYNIKLISKIAVQ